MDFFYKEGKGVFVNLKIFIGKFIVRDFINES